MKSKPARLALKRLPLARLHTVSLRSRPSRVGRRHFAVAPRAAASFRTFWEALPRLQGAADLRACVAAVGQARSRGRPCLLMLGGHVVKCGLTPVIVALMRKGVFTHLALNGAAAIHDFELALAGKTSEDVGARLGDGSFGMTRETGTLMNRAVACAEAGRGLGEIWGKLVDAPGFPYRADSLLAEAHRLGIPLTAHVAIGTDVIHPFPDADGASWGRAAFADFHRMIAAVSGLEGGVVLNWGSAVLLPEVFLKALSTARNLGRRVRRFTAVNFDQIYHYRPRVNLVERPTREGGRGLNLVGQHEILIPLFAWALAEELGKRTF